MKVKFIDYQKDYLRFRKEYDAAWESVNMRGDLILRRDVEEFEVRLAEYVGTKYAVALNSGTDALYLSVKVLSAKDSEVLVPSHTFKSTCGAVLTAERKPKLYDLGERPSGFLGIVAHIAGEIYEPPKVRYLIEDACQALGALKNPTSEVQCWSFYPAKILGSKGDAGAITINDPLIYEYIKEARNHFKKENEDFGINSRMDNLQAALLNVKIQHIDEILRRRKEIAERYLEELEWSIDLPNNPAGRVWQDFIVYTSKREELFNFLKEAQIETIRNEYPFTPSFPKLPLAGDYEAKTLRIPCNENLEDSEVEYVISKIKEFYAISNM